MKTLRQELSADGRLDILDRVMSYRGGYSQEASQVSCGVPIRLLNHISLQDRRRIEREAFSGNLLGIVATNALELGVDIGVLDAVIMLGFPMGGLASFVSAFTRQVHAKSHTFRGNKRDERDAAREMRLPSSSQTHCPWINITYTIPRSYSIVRRVT